MKTHGSWKHSFCALLVGLTSGCVHRPTEMDRRDLVARVAGPDSDAFKASDRPGPDPAPDPSVIRADSGPLTLEGARRIALESNPSLAQARASADLAVGNAQITDSGFLPTVQGNYAFQAFSSEVGFAGTRGRFPVLPVRGFGPGTQDFHVVEAQLKWTIFQFGKQLAKHDQAGLRVEIARLEAERACQSVAFEVARAYFRVLEARSAVETAERAVARAEEFAKEAGDLLRRGVITREEELRAEASLAGVRQGRSDARSEEEVAVAGLNRAMGILVNAPTRIVDRREAPRTDLSLKQALDLAASHRREIPVVVRGISIAEGDVSIARADFLPSVSIQAGLSNITGTGVQNANVGAGGLFVTHDLYGGGRRRGQLRAAEAGVRAALAQAQQVCDGIAYEVNVAYRGLEDSRERIGSARAVFEQSRENLRLVASRSRNGDATPAELIEAQAAETQSEQSYNAATYLYQVALARLEFAVGVELPLAPGELPEVSREERGAGPTEAPPSATSPFGRRSNPFALPGLPPPADLGRPERPDALPLPSPIRPDSPDNPRLFGPPSLSRPPYESTSPFGIKP